MTIVVTGAAGFIGSNLIKALNANGETDIIAVDNMRNGIKFRNLVDCEIAHFMDKEDFLQAIISRDLDDIQSILHQGACSDTLEQNGHYILNNNYQYTLELFQYCQEEEIPFIYASSAAVYGASSVFKEARQYELPLNVYGYSKFLFDQVFRRYQHELTSQVVGLRYFNVYGPREAHKGRMASVAFHHFKQYQATGKVQLFEGTSGYAHGEQHRDFISVEDIVKVNLYFLENSQYSGIFNVGTGRAQSFNDIALTVVNTCRHQNGQQPLSLTQLIEEGILEYIPFPEEMKNTYQSFTQADITQLRNIAFYKEDMLNVEVGVQRYITALLNDK